MHREPTMECGGVIKGEAPPNRGGVSQYTLSRKTPPPQHAMLQNHARAQRAWGALGVVYTPGGHMNIWGCTNVWGHTNVQGVYKCGASNHPQV